MVDVSSTSIEPGRTEWMTVKLEPMGTGAIEKSIFVATNDPARMITAIKVRADVQEEVHEVAGVNPRKSVFSAECQSCHFPSEKVNTGPEIFGVVCAVCHGALGSEDRTGSLNTVRLAQDLKDLRKKIASGTSLNIPHGFSTTTGGPLSESQIDSLVELFKKWQVAEKKKHGKRD